MAFAFGGASLADTKKKVKFSALENPLFESKTKGNSRHVLVLHPVYNEKEMRNVNTMFSKLLAGFDVENVSASRVQATKDQIKAEGIFRFYRQYGTDISPYMREGTILIPLGMALSFITRSSDLSNECFYDVVTNKTYAYTPRFKTWFFPMDDWEVIMAKRKRNGESSSLPDSSRMEYMKYQLGLIKDKYETLKADNKQDELTIEVVDTKEKFAQFCVKYRRKIPVAWDTETTGLDFMLDKLICITMSFDGKHGYYIPWDVVDIELLTEFFRGRYQILANGKFDCHFMLKAGVKTVKVDSDVIQLGQLLNEMRFNGLKSLAYHYSKWGGYDEELDLFIDKYKPTNYGKIPLKILKDYATKDAIITFQVYEKQQEHLYWLDEKFPPRRGWWTAREFYEKIKIPAVNRFIKMEQHGVHVNMERWDAGSIKVNDKIIQIKTRIESELGIDVGDPWSNLSDDDIPDENEKSLLQSGKKLGELLEKLGWPDLGRAKAGYYLAGDEQLARWANMGYDIAKDLQKLRSYWTMQKTFIGLKDNYSIGWRRYVRTHEDGSKRIHPSYKSMMMNTMRNGCGDPNWQQLPSGAIDADLFKKAIGCPNEDDYYLVTLDYASFQIRLAAIDIRDDNDFLFKLYKQNPNVDLHTKTAYNVFIKDKKFKLLSGEFREINEEELLKEIANGNKELKAYRQMAKSCFSGDTKVLTKQLGLVALKDLVPAINSGLHTPFVDSIDAVTPSGESTPIEFSIYGQTDEWMEVELENGDVIKMTPNHNCLVIRNGIRLSVKASDLLETDQFLQLQT